MIGWSDGKKTLRRTSAMLQRLLDGGFFLLLIFSSLKSLFIKASSHALISSTSSDLNHHIFSEQRSIIRFAEKRISGKRS